MEEDVLAYLASLVLLAIGLYLTFFSQKAHDWLEQWASSRQSRYFYLKEFLARFLGENHPLIKEYISLFWVRLLGIILTLVSLITIWGMINVQIR